VGGVGKVVVVMLLETCRSKMKGLLRGTVGGVGKVVVVMLFGTCRSPLEDENEMKANEVRRGTQGNKRSDRSFDPGHSESILKCTSVELFFH
jgi:hypothetical protein